jgi:hypothetical protein
MEGLNEIAKALAAAQLEMSNPKFDAQNPHFKNRFASLAAVRNSVVPVLAKHGISLTQDLTTVDGGVACKTILTHASGQQMVFGPLVMPAQGNAQVFGSASSYAKRYAMMAVVAVVGDEDDDAEKVRENSAPTNGRDVAKLARAYADRFHKAFEVGLDQAVIDIANELSSDHSDDHAVYKATWGILPSGMRRQIKDLVDRDHKAQETKQ